MRTNTITILAAALVALASGTAAAQVDQHTGDRPIAGIMQPNGLVAQSFRPRFESFAGIDVLLPPEVGGQLRMELVSEDGEGFGVAFTEVQPRPELQVVHFEFPGGVVLRPGTSYEMILATGGQSVLVCTDCYPEGELRGPEGPVFFNGRRASLMFWSLIDVECDLDLDTQANCHGEIDNCIQVDNPDQADADGDGIGDACDAPGPDPEPEPEPEPQPDRDVDGDGFVNEADNCPLLANTSQADADNDGIGDRCDRTDDRDVDGDYIPNADDACPFDPSNQCDTGGCSAAGDGAAWLLALALALPLGLRRRRRGGRAARRDTLRAC